MGRTGSGVIEELIPVIAVGTLPIGILSFMFLGWTAGITVFVVGWFLLVPLFGVLSDRSDGERETTSKTADTATTDQRDPLETLRERYARGEIDEAEFERRLEDLLETDPDESASRVDERSRELERE